jgi:hypothetical protein
MPACSPYWFFAKFIYAAPPTLQRFLPTAKTLSNLRFDATPLLICGIDWGDHHAAFSGIRAQFSMSVAIQQFQIQINQPRRRTLNLTHNIGVRHQC